MVPQERVQQRTAEQVVDVPQFLEETVELMRLVPHERAQCIGEQMVEVPIPQSAEENGEEIADVPFPAVESTEALQYQFCDFTRATCSPARKRASLRYIRTELDAG